MDINKNSQSKQTKLPYKSNMSSLFYSSELISIKFPCPGGLFGQTITDRAYVSKAGIILSWIFYHFFEQEICFQSCDLYFYACLQDRSCEVNVAQITKLSTLEMYFHSKKWQKFQLRIIPISWSHFQLICLFNFAMFSWWQAHLHAG